MSADNSTSSLGPYTVEVASLTVQRGARQVLNVPELRARGGEFIGIIGPNGAGKSSLLKALTGEWLASGSISVLGLPLARWQRTALARRVAVMAQQSNLAFDFTVREVVTLGRLPHRGEPFRMANAAVDGALQALSLMPFAQRYFTTLSGGERQRVQFARVLTQIWGETRERLLLLDEPTSALDLAQQKSVLDHAWHASREGATVIAVMHDLNMVSRYADRLWVLQQGQLKADAVPSQFMTVDMVQSVFGMNVHIERAMSDDKPVVLMQPDWKRSAPVET